VTFQSDLEPSSITQVAMYFYGWSTLRFIKFEGQAFGAGFLEQPLRLRRDFSISGQ